MISLATLSFTKPKEILVDIGCGAGHFLQQAEVLTKDQSLLGIDFDFSLLLLARWFVLTPTIPLVCADIEQGIPLQTKSVETITVNDAFQYFKQKTAFVTETKRVLKPNGQVLLTHVHFHGADNPGQGEGLTTQEMKQFATNLSTSVNSDQALFKDLIENNLVSYLPLQNFKQKQPRSVSLRLTHHQPTTFSTPLWPTIQTTIAQTEIDFTEDENLKP